jgi:hypothetical protein
LAPYQTTDPKFSMKKLVAISAFVMVTAVSALAQGRVTFASGAPSVNARFAILGDPAFGTNFITGSMPQFRADLFWTPGITTVGVPDSALVNQGNYNQLFSTVAPQAGLFLGGVKTVNGWTTGQIVAQVRVWDTTFGNFDQAKRANGLWITSPRTEPDWPR